jgi:hypothetical protein
MSLVIWRKLFFRGDRCHISMKLAMGLSGKSQWFTLLCSTFSPSGFFLAVPFGSCLGWCHNLTEFANQHGGLPLGGPGEPYCFSGSDLKALTDMGPKDAFDEFIPGLQFGVGDGKCTRAPWRTYRKEISCSWKSSSYPMKVLKILIDSVFFYQNTACI